MSSSEKKIAQCLEDALVLEGSLRRRLIAHIAVSPRDRHRALLEQHLKVTVAQERRIDERLQELRGGPGVMQSAVGVAKASAALGLTLAKGPLVALRGTAGDHFELRNVQDESASEAREIAVYDTLEALAIQGGDLATAELAREHREQAQDFLEQLRELIPELARRDDPGARGFPWSAPGIVHAGRVLLTGARAALRPGGDTAAPASGSSAGAVRQQTAPAGPAPGHSGGGVKAKAAEAARANRADGRPDQPLAEYDEMSPYEIGELLDHLPADRLDAVEAYERAHDQRRQVLDAIAEQRELDNSTRR